MFISQYKNPNNIIMASLEEAYEKIVSDKDKQTMERTFNSILKERERAIEPFTQKQNDLNGVVGLVGNKIEFPIQKSKL